MDRIFQGKSKIIQTKKTVDWLVSNTKVNVFNPISFEGYQRTIDENHCEKIVSYLNKEFFLPTSIICASRQEYSEDQELFIVDGQHRVRAFDLLKQRNPDRYAQIKDNEISVIVLEQVEEEVEIDTFITINKKSKKVDTSLAYVLKNKINYNRASKDISISKREYLSVELASFLNSAEKGINRYWENRISFEGIPTKQTAQLISLNAFVKSMRTLLGYLEKYKVINLNWNSQDELDTCIQSICYITNYIWDEIKNKWNELFDSDIEKRRILQGSIGFSSINRFIVLNLKRKNIDMSIDEFLNEVAVWIRAINHTSVDWLPGESFSKYSSESGFSIVAQELLEGMKM